MTDGLAQHAKSDSKSSTRAKEKEHVQDDRPKSDDALQSQTTSRSKQAREPAERQPSDRDAKPDEQPHSPTDGGPKQKISRKTIIIGSVVAACVLAGGLFYYLLTKDIESTDDAQVAGNSVMIAPKISGQVSQILVNDNQRVRAGDLLFQIDPRDYIAARDKSKANLGIARAQLDNARVNLEMTKITAPAKLELAKAQVQGAMAGRDIADSNAKRQNALSDLATTAQNKEQAASTFKNASATVDQNQAQVTIASLVDQAIAQAQAQVDQYDAQVKQAQADLDTAELNLSYTEIRAPYDGWATKRNSQVGSYVQPGVSMMALVSPDVWIVANFKENQLNRMRPGQEVKVKVDAYSKLELKGHVDTLQMGTGSVFTAFPAENATGNFVKIVQRVPVKIVIDSGMDPTRPLPLGLSVIPSVNLK